MQGDARFFNFETTLNREGEAYGSQFSDSHIRTTTEALDGLTKLDFNYDRLQQSRACALPHRACARDFFAEQEMDGNETVHTLSKKRSKNSTAGLMEKN